MFKKFFFGSDRSSRSQNACVFGTKLYKVKSIFIFLAQIFMLTSPGLPPQGKCPFFINQPYPIYRVAINERPIV